MGRVTADASGSDRPVLVVLAAGMAKRYGGCKPLAPVGLHGEAVIDLIAGDAVSAGFGHIVFVLGPQTGPAITYHVRRCFPSRIDVAFAEQPVPLGTAHAVLCARKHVGDGPFAVVNADDVYGTPAMRQLARSLAEHQEHAIVSYRLRDTVVADAPVTRGTCDVGPDGNLVRLVERRGVARLPDGTFSVGDGLDPGVLSGDTPVSMNLWGFQPSIWPVVEAAVLATHPSVSPDGTVSDASDLADRAEVLLPEVVGDMIAGRTTSGETGDVRVINGEGRCIGVTHADDLPVVRNELALLVAQGLRPEGPWDATI
jgi:CTP:molybdopterin cytidylyltransferase MocA